MGFKRCQRCLGALPQEQNEACCFWSPKQWRIDGAGGQGLRHPRQHTKRVWPQPGHTRTQPPQPLTMPGEFYSLSHCLELISRERGQFPGWPLFALRPRRLLISESSSPGVGSPAVVSSIFSLAECNYWAHCRRSQSPEEAQLVARSMFTTRVV